MIKELQIDLNKCPNCEEEGCLKRTDNSMYQIHNDKGNIEIMPITKCEKCNSYFEEGFERDEKGELVFGIYTDKLNKRAIKHYGCDRWIF